MLGSDFKIEKIDLNNIFIDELLCDREEEEFVFDQKLMELAKSIEELGGLIHPILLEKHEGKKGYSVIVGKKRVGAFRMLAEKHTDGEFSAIPSIVLESKDDTWAAKKIAIAIHENKERSPARSIGQLKIQLVAIASASKALTGEDSSSEAIMKGIIIFKYAYVFNNFKKDDEKYSVDLPCTKEEALAGYDYLVDNLGVSARSISKKIKLLSISRSVSTAVDMGWISLGGAFEVIKKKEKSKEIADELDSLFENAKKLDASAEEKKKYYAAGIARISLKEVKKKTIIMGRREHNAFKKKFTTITDKISFLDNTNPRLKLIKEHTDSILKLLEG